MDQIEEKVDFSDEQQTTRALQLADLKLKELNIEKLKTEIDIATLEIKPKELAAVKGKIYFYNFVVPILLCHLIFGGIVYGICKRFLLIEGITEVEGIYSKIGLGLFLTLYFGICCFFSIKYILSRKNKPKIPINTQLISLHEYLLKYEKQQRQQVWFLLFFWLLPLVIIPAITFGIIKKIRARKI